MSNPIHANGAAWQDGDIIPIAQAGIPILDWGFLRSDATYDVVHVWKKSSSALTTILNVFLSVWRNSA